MEIPPEFKPTDPIQRPRRSAQAAQAASGHPAPVAPAASAGSGANDSAAVGQGFDAASVERFVGVLKTMNPLNLHRVEDLRQRIADGRYSAGAEELAELLMGDEPRPGDAPRGPARGA
jgi:anti-sigma28 factor (negative regulator of flagellin synthesis)